MLADEAQEPGRGHNQPPGLLPLEQAVLDLKEFLEERGQEGGKTFAQRRDEFLRAAAAAVVRSRDTAGSAADVIKLAGRVWDRIHAARMERSQPYRDTADALGRSAVEFWEPVAEAMRGLLRKIDDWSDAEDRRIEQQQREQNEEMERLRARAAPAAAQQEPKPSPETGRAYMNYAKHPPAQTAPAAPPARRKARGDYGAVVAATERTVYSVSDVRALPDYILNAPAVHEAIVAAVRTTVKVMGVPPGIATTTTTTNQIR